MERHTAADPACARIAALLHERVDGTLDAGAQADLDAHLASCAACRDLLADLGAIRRTAADDPRLHAAARGLGEPLGPARRRISPPRPRHFWTGTRVALAMAATLVVAVTASVWLVRSPAPASAPQASAPPPAGDAAGVIQSNDGPRPRC